MIIVEGPDGAGKTTLVERIENDWGLTREPRAVSSEAKSLVPIGEWIETELGKGFGMRLYDRFGLISSPCYAMLENRTMVWPLTWPDWMRAQHRRIRKIDPVIIWCMPELATVRANLKREDNSGGRIFPHIDEIYLAYVAAYGQMSALTNSQMIWDYEKPDLVHLANLLRWAKARTEREQDGGSVLDDDEAPARASVDHPTARP